MTVEQGMRWALFAGISAPAAAAQPAEQKTADHEGDPSDGEA